METIKQTIYRDFRQHGINEEIIKTVLETLEGWLEAIKGSDIRIDSRIDLLNDSVLHLIYEKADQYMIDTLVFENRNHPFIRLFKERKYE